MMLNNTEYLQTYHCKVAGVEWRFDARLFSFSSSLADYKNKTKHDYKCGSIMALT